MLLKALPVVKVPAATERMFLKTFYKQSLLRKAQLAAGFKACVETSACSLGSQNVRSQPPVLGGTCFEWKLLLPGNFSLS